MATEAEIRIIARDEASRVISSVRGNLDKLTASTSSASKETSSFTSKAAAMATGLIAAQVSMQGLASIIGFYSQSINAAKDLGESQNAVNRVFGESSAKIHKWGEDSANAYGLSERAFNQMATPLGAMLKNSGVSIDEVADRTITLTERAADMASVFNTDVTDALMSIQAALRGERDPIEKFGVSINEAAVKAKALSMGLAPVTVDAMELKEAELDLAEAQEKLNQLMNKMPSFIAPTRTELLAIEQAQVAYNKAVQESGFGSLAARVAQEKLNVARENAKPVITGAAATELELEKAQLAVEQAQIKVNEAAAGSIPQLDAAAKQQATYALILEQTAAYAGDYIDTSDQLANKERNQRAEMEELQATIGKKLLPVQLALTNAKMEMVRVLAYQVIPKLEELYKKHWPAIKIELDKVIAFVKENWPLFKTIMEVVIEQVVAKIEGFFQKIRGIIKVVDGVIDLLEAIWHGRWKDAWEAAKQILSGAIDIIIGTLKETFGSIPEKALKWGKDIITGLIDGIIEEAKKLAGVIQGNVIDPIKDKIKSGFGLFSPSREFHYYGEMMMEGLSDGIQSRYQSEVAPAMAGVMGSVEKMAVQVKTLFSNLPQKIETQTISTSDGASLNVSSGGGSSSLTRSVRLPGFASGHPYIPFDNYPALLHRGERVLTAQENKNLGGLTVNVYVAGSIRSDKDLVRLIKDEFQSGGFRGSI